MRATQKPDEPYRRPPALSHSEDHCGVQRRKSIRLVCFKNSNNTVVHRPVVTHSPRFVTRIYPRPLYSGVGEEVPCWAYVMDGWAYVVAGYRVPYDVAPYDVAPYDVAPYDVAPYDSGAPYVEPYVVIGAA